MICPACGHDNLPGEDECARCGTPLTGSDRPSPQSRFESRLSGLASHSPVLVPRSMPASEAIETMRDAAADAILVVDHGRLAGIFTERDALIKLAGRRLAGLTVGDVMTRDPVVLREDDTVAVAINKMAVGGFRHIPLVELGRPTGIVTAADVFHRIVAIAG